MSASILPFSLAKSNEKLTDRGAVAMVDEFAKAVGLPEKVKREVPSPGSNAGIEPSVYVRTLMYQFAEGGRHIEEVRQIKADRGFRKLVDIGHMPGPDAVGNWLRRMGGQGRQEALRRCNDLLVRRYLRRTPEEKDSADQCDRLTLDVDATIIEADKGDGRRAYDGTVGYQPMLGFLSNGRRKPCCSYVKFRQGNASPQVGIEEAITHTLGIVEEEGRSLKHFRSCRTCPAVRRIGPT